LKSCDPVIGTTKKRRRPRSILRRPQAWLCGGVGALKGVAEDFSHVASHSSLSLIVSDYLQSQTGAQTQSPQRKSRTDFIALCPLYRSAVFSVIKNLSWKMIRRPETSRVTASSILLEKGGLVYCISVFFGLATEPSRSPDTESTEEKQDGFHTSVFSVSELCVLCDKKIIEGTAKASRSFSCYCILGWRGRGSTRVSRVVLGVAPRIIRNERKGLGETPKPTRGTRVLPGPFKAAMKFFPGWAWRLYRFCVFCHVAVKIGVRRL